MFIRWNYIEEEMKRKNIKNSEVYKKLEISRDTWCKYKKNESNISVKMFYQVLEMLDLDFYDVVKKTELTK